MSELESRNSVGIAQNAGSRHRRLLVNALKYSVGIVLLGWMIWRNWAGLHDAFARPIQWLPLSLACLCFMTAVALTFVRWYVLVHAQELPLSLLNTLRLGLLGFFWNTFLPGSIGGDIVKAAYIAREQSRRTIAVATVLIDRAMGLWGIILLVALLGGVFWIGGNPIVLEDGYLRSIILSSVVIVVVTVGVWLLLGILPAWRADRFARRLGHIPRIGGSAAEFWCAIRMYRTKRDSMATALLLSLASQFFFIFTYFYTAQIFRDPAQAVSMPGLREHFLLIPIGTAVQALFPSPGGMGGAQLVYGWLYARVDPAMEATGVLASIARDVIAWGLGLIGYFVYLRMRPSLPPPVKEEIEIAAAS